MPMGEGHTKKEGTGEAQQDEIPDMMRSCYSNGSGEKRLSQVSWAVGNIFKPPFILKLGLPEPHLWLAFRFLL